MKNELIETIEYHIQNKLLMTVERIFNGEKTTVEGFPLIVSNKLLFMTVIVDFRDEGYTILRTDDISDAYSKESYEFNEKICIAEGLQEKTIPSFIDDFSDIKQALTQLQLYNGFVSIQCEKQIDKCTFYMGKILKINNDVVIFKDLDMYGKWDEELNEISFSEITQITFGDNYSRMYYKYVE